MKNKNTSNLHKKNDSNVQIGLMVFTFLLSISLYNLWFFVPLDDTSELQSKIFLVVFLILNISIGILADSCYLPTLLLPYLIYTYVTYQLWGGLKNVLLIIIGIIVALIVFFVLIRKISTIQYGSGKIIQKRLCKCIRFAQTVTFFIFGIITIPCMFWLKICEIKYDNARMVPEEKNAISFEDNLQLFLPLYDDDLWNILGEEDKLTLLKMIIDQEAARAGLGYDIEVTVAYLHTETLALYSHECRRITLNRYHMSSNDAVLLSVLHELRHSYQHTLAEVFCDVSTEYRNLEIFSEAKGFFYNLKDYISSTEDYMAYKKQPCEVDANEFAKERTIFYIETIQDYVNNVPYDTEHK